ncbi:MAG: BON domain-containing protein [Burkholderiales bacterium]
MNFKLTIAAALLSTLLPVGVYAADTANNSTFPSSAKDTATITTPRDRHAVATERSAHPVDDSLITTKIKGKLLGDKQVRLDNIEIKTLNGDVELFGTAKNRANGRRAVTLAHQVKGVKSVKNNIEIAPSDATAASDKPRKTERTAKMHRSDDRMADTQHSDQPVSDSWITSKVKAKLVKDKEVKARNIHVKTIDGVVQLSGFAGNADQVARAADLARDIKGVKSVNNDIAVK